MTDDYAPTPAEVESATGEGTPAEVAGAFLDAVVVEDSLELAWLLCDDDLRLALVQEWMIGVGLADEATRDALAAELAQPLGSDHPLWPAFAVPTLAGFRESWPAEGYDSLGVPGDPRPIAPGLELVPFVTEDSWRRATNTPPGEPPRRRTGPVTIEVYANLLMRLTDGGWRVASLSDREVTTDWSGAAR